jgi:cellulose synthase/poly-beta-1,6-N-acetylglucosamine synthase-like glycosyltransferase
MELVLSILFWSSLLGIVHSYVLYPLIVAWKAKGKQVNNIQYSETDEWPEVSIMMSVYNEERVIKEKMESLVQLNYFPGKVSIYIGSDCSSDRTNDIVSAYAQQWEQVHFFPFEQRRGKPGVVNELYEKVSQQASDKQQHILIITDASVMMQPFTLQQMVKHFKNPRIGLVDSHIIHTGVQSNGISKVEDQYISSEAKLKNREGIAWGKMIGPFGGCYAIRLSYFSAVPSTYLVDDFYITMRMFEKGADAINELKAICYEGVSHENL